MKKNFLFVIVFAFFVIFLSGCAASHLGFMSDSASLSSNNFKFVKPAQGYAETTIIFGIGGLKKDALVAEAKSDLLQKNPLKDGQTLANVCVDFKYTFYFGIVIVTRATVTGDIVEFK